MSDGLMVEPDKIDRIERTLVGVEKAVVELATIQKEAAKREERNQAESAKREERLYKRMDRVEEQVRINTNLLWKFTGAITAIVTIITVAISVYGIIQP